MKTKLGLFLGILSATVALVTTTADPAFALCTPAQTASNRVGDDYYMCGGPGFGGWQCTNYYIGEFWDRYGFDDSWDDRGYDDPCNNSKKLAQTFNAISVLLFAHNTTPTCNFNVDYVAEGGECYAATQIDTLRARVGDGTANASADKWPNLGRVTLFNLFFTMDVAQRAGTLYHEARHADGCAHNAGKNCGRKTSCDKSWNNGCPAAGNDAGANRYHITFLRAYYVSTRSTFAMRSGALTRANDMLADAFRDNPCFRFNSSGAAYDSCN